MTSTAELLPGYYIEDSTGAWLTLPWPDDLKDLPPSLGPGVIRHAEANLRHHLTGEPWRYTRGQKRFLHMWYAVDSEGKFPYRSGVKRGAKGTGKDPFGASWCFEELCGPVEFSHFDANGNAVGKARNMALVQIAANSEAQAKDVMRVMGGMIPRSTRDEYGIEVGVKQAVMAGGGRVEILTSSEASSEGDPATAILLNESHHMTEASGGHALAEVARRNVAKSPKYIAARLLEMTNAHMDGMDSEAERTFKAWQAQVSGEAKRVDILYDSREADPALGLTSDEEIMLGLRQAYGDAEWTDLNRLLSEIYDTRTSEADAIRYYFNGLAAAQDAWVEPRKFDALKIKVDAEIKPKEQISLFLDCSKTNDATGLVGCRISDGHVFVLGKWQKPKGSKKLYQVPRHEVDAAVRSAWDRYKVVWFGVDPSPAEDDDELLPYWGGLIDEWHRDFHKKLSVWAGPRGVKSSSVLFDMRMSSHGGALRNQIFTEAAMQCAHDIDEDSALTHDGNPHLRQHVHNARRRPNKWGVTLAKQGRASSKKVDLAVCMVGARLGRKLALNSGKVKKKRASASF